jgi:hypothetical protein
MNDLINSAKIRNAFDSMSMERTCQW